MSILHHWMVRLAIGMAVFLVSLLGTWTYLGTQREAAAQAAHDASRCAAMARQIGRLKGQAAVAGSREMATDELARVIEEASRGAGIAPDSLVRINPEPARRVGDSAMKQAPTEVALQQVTLKQLIAFLHALSTGRPPLQVRSIRLIAPPEEASAENWTAELTLAHLVYSPAGSPGGRQ